MRRRARSLAAVALALLAQGAARGDSNIYGVPGECQLEVVECSTAAVDSTRPAPRVLSSVFMENYWTMRGYEPSPDGKTLLVPIEDGIRLVRDGRRDDYRLERTVGQPDWVWLPDSRRVAFWVKATRPAVRPGETRVPVRAVAILDVTRLPPAPLPAGERVPYDVVHWFAPTSSPFGLMVAPDGQALLVIASELDPETNEMSGVVTRVPLDPAVHGPAVAIDPARPDRTRELVRMPGAVDFAWPEGGVAPVTSGRLLVGHADGLFITDARGGRIQRFPDLPSAGIYNLAWSGDRVLVFYRRPATARSGKLYRGLYLLDVEAALGEPAKPPEQLHDRTDAHSLWFSPRGTYATWSTSGGVWFRAPGAPPADTVEVTIPALPSGEELPVKGMAWSADETKLAITAGNRLYIYEVATKAFYVVAERGKAVHTFLAQPTWRGDDVIVSSYEDASRSGRVRPR